MYKQSNPIFNGAEVNSVLKIQNGIVVACIPFDPANTDYQQYLAWLEEGGQPLPADENSNA